MTPTSGLEVPPGPHLLLDSRGENVRKDLFTSTGTAMSPTPTNISPLSAFTGYYQPLGYSQSDILNAFTAAQNTDKSINLTVFQQNLPLPPVGTGIGVAVPTTSSSSGTIRIRNPVTGETRVLSISDYNSALARGGFTLWEVQ